MITRLGPNKVIGFTFPYRASTTLKYFNKPRENGIVVIRKVHVICVINTANDRER